MTERLDNAKNFRPIDPAGSPPGLPVYRLEQSSHSLLYTPGLVALVTPELGDRLCDSLLEGFHLREPGALVELKARILKRAGEALRAYMNFRNGAF